MRREYYLVSPWPRLASFLLLSAEDTEADTTKANTRLQCQEIVLTSGSAVHLYTPEEHYRGDAIEQDLGVEEYFVSAPIREGIRVIGLIHAI